MPNSSSGTSIEHVRQQIKSIEDNSYCTQQNPTINHPPAVREGEDGFKKKKSYGG